MLTWKEHEKHYRIESHYGDRTVMCLAERPRSLFAMLAKAASGNPQGDALACGDFRCDWRELLDLVETVAGGLHGLGVAGGDRVVLFLGNRAEFVIALFAIARIGAVAVPVGTREQAPGLAYIVEQSGACAIIHESELAALVPPGPATISVGAGSPLDFVAGLKRANAPLPEIAADEEAPALIMYTSGTTGRPKGAIVTGLALVHAGAAYTACMELSRVDRSVCFVPLSHITGITATICAMTFCRGCMIIAPSFRAEDFTGLAVRERMTHSLMVPAMYNLLLARGEMDGEKLSNWRIGGFGGAPMPVPSIEALATRLPGLHLMNCYGATETCGGVTVLPSSELTHNSDSVGWPVPGAIVTVVNENGVAVGHGEVGEILIGGPQISPGYWRNADATEANFRDGFWKSGDLGTIDARGLFRVVDRLKDMINRGGYKIYSAEVEGVLAGHPAVLEAAVVGVPCEILGQRVEAFIALREDAVAEPAELTAFCRARLTDYKVPERFHIGVAPLPRNPNGKILKRMLEPDRAIT